MFNTGSSTIHTYIENTKAQLHFFFILDIIIPILFDTNFLT